MKELLFSLTKKDFTLQVFRAGGKGGQKQNKTSSGVRIIHAASGARGESREERNQSANKKRAFARLVETKEFQNWLKLRAAEIASGETTEQWLDRMMVPENLKVEYLGTEDADE